MTKRVIIVGAGLLGLTTAYFLRRHGAEVVVVERRTGAGEETSFANGSMLHASQANPWNEPGILWRALAMLGREESALLVRLRALPSLLAWGTAFVRASAPARYLQNFEKNARLAAYSLAQMAELRAVCALDYDFQSRGTLKLFRTHAAVESALRVCAQLAEWGIAYEVLDAERAVIVEPALAPIQEQLAGGLFFPRDEAGDAWKFCVALTAQLRRDQVEFRFETNAQRISRRAPHLLIHTTREIAAADALVLAAGSYTPSLARTVGLHVPVAPVKGYSLTLPLNGWSAGPQVPVIDDHLHAAVCPLGERLRIAGTAEFAGFDLALTPRRIENLFSFVTTLYPAFVPHLERATARAWTGLRPMSSDGVGIMGATTVPGVFLNTGHGPLGWTMAAGAGRLVADQIMGVPPALPLAPYALARF